MHHERTTAEHSPLFVQQLLDEAQISSYGQNGYLVLGMTVTNEGLRRMREQVMEIWTRKKDGFDPNGSWLKNGLLTNIHHDSSVVRDFYFRGPLVDIAEQLIGPNIKAATAQLTFKLRGNTQAVGWHQDNGYGEIDPYNAISALTALDDCDLGNGCLWVIPGSHQKGQLFKRPKPQDKYEEIRMEVDETGAVPIPLKPGQTLVMHGWTLHKSEGNHSRDRDRRIIFFRYADADAVEVYNDRRPRLGRLLRGETRFDEVRAFEANR